jgi:hypothetical protein
VRNQVFCSGVLIGVLEMRVIACVLDAKGSKTWFLVASLVYHTSRHRSNEVALTSLLSLSQPFGNPFDSPSTELRTGLRATAQDRS